VAAVDRAARGGENLVPVIINAVEAHATVGEIADTLRGAFGEFHDASAE
jgi:methylmalonyl-CoA mutase N-terminal domain/subunit